MKPDSEHQKDPHSQSENPQQDWDDSAWSLLGKASRKEPGAMFARNIVRETRLIGRPRATLAGIIPALSAPIKISLATAVIAAVACVMGVSHFWPKSPSSPIPVLAHVSETQESAAALAELLISESLSAAAEDPSLFTRDEVVAMIGF